MKNENEKFSFYIRAMKYLKKHWGATIIFVATIFMFFIHILYKIHAVNNFFVSEWTAGDVLAYGGSIIGALATIYVLQETIKSTANMQREERIFSVRPYFMIDAQTYDKNIINEHEIIDISCPVIDKKWSGDIEILIKVVNVGVGNAIDAKIELSQNDVGNLEYEYVNLPIFLIGAENYFLVRFCKQTSLTFKLIYRDIASLAQYMVCTDIRIVCSGGKTSTYCLMPKLERINTAI